MRTVSEQTKIPLATLYSWREKVRADPGWRPSSEYFSTNPRTFPPKVETMFADFICLHFASEGRALTRPTLRPLLLMLVHDLVAEGVLEQQASTSEHRITSCLASCDESASASGEPGRSGAPFSTKTSVRTSWQMW
jgi:hypothetical protein